MRTFLLCLAACAAALPGNSEENAFELNALAFKPFVTENAKVLVFAYKEDCPLCEDIRKFLPRLAHKYKPHGVFFGSVDVDAHPAVAEALETQVTPFLAFYLRGEWISFRAVYDEAEVDEVLQRLYTREPELRYISKQQHFDEVQQLDFAGVYRPEHAQETLARQPLFDLLSLAFDFPVYYSRLMLDLPPGDLLYLHRKFGDGPKVISGVSQKSAKEVAQFVEFYRDPLCQQMTEQNTARVLRHRDPFIVAIARTLDDPAIAHLQDALADAEKKIACFYGLPRSPNAEAVMYALGNRLKRYPKVGILDYGERDYMKYHLEDTSKEAIVRFIADYHGGRLAPSYRAEPVPDEQGGVLKVVRGNHAAVVGDPAAHVLVAYVTGWCEHCKDVPRALDAARKRLRASVRDVVLAQMNMDFNELDDFRPTEYPTALLYKIGAKAKPVEYRGIWDAEVLLNFIEDETGARGRLYDRAMPDAQKRPRANADNDL